MQDAFPNAISFYGAVVIMGSMAATIPAFLLSLM